MESIVKKLRTKVSFKRCSASDKNKFSSSKCIMPISVGVQIHEGEKFLETMKLINSHFKACVLLVDDSIQKYTLKIEEPNSSLEQLYVKAVKAGQEWLQRNKQAYEQLTIPYKIMHWDDWLSHEKFTESYANIETLYNYDKEYKKIVHASIDNFISRYTSRPTKDNFNKEHAINCCLKYLKEECAVMCLWAIEGFNFEVYPSGRNQAMIATYERLVLPKNPNLLKSISLYFEKKNIVNTKPHRTEETTCYQYG